MAVIFGELVDTCGETVDTNKLVHKVSKQDVGFFDKETNTGEIVERMSGDTVIIQDAMGEKLSSRGGFFPLFDFFDSSLVVSAAAMTFLMAKFMSRGQTAYLLAATVVEQMIGSIRTVVSFTGERQAIANYDKSLNEAYTSGVQEGLAVGCGAGLFMFVIFSSYGLAVWFGARMILNGSYTGGDVINVMMAMLTGSFSLGQACPCLGAFTAGQIAAFKMFQTIHRKSEIDPYDVNGQKLDDIRGDIELKDVCFSYPSRPHEKIFNRFTLSIPSGTTSALVGQSGSGKSTEIKVAAELANAAKFIDKLPQVDIQIRFQYFSY
ncbi:hypothetical protein LguiB_025458 [Lonicera macranthoides]